MVANGKYPLSLRMMMMTMIHTCHTLARNNTQASIEPGPGQTLSPQASYCLLHLLHLLDDPLHLLDGPLHLLDGTLHLLQPLDELTLRLPGEVRLLHHEGLGAEIKLHTGLGFLRTGEHVGQIREGFFYTCSKSQSLHLLC